ncbi:MAG: hypothetical protein JSS43_06530 [Proteobacteria bacterium]|nr:hypothetical protein [Pseudomonadota bacterium]
MKTPNSWANATVLNDWGSSITNVRLYHRYDTDHFDENAWPILHPNEAGAPFRVGYWTGLLRTGLDYWKIEFVAGGHAFTCKDDFYCFLKAKDRDQLVTCRVYRDGLHPKMDVVCPASSHCSVSLVPVPVTAKQTPRPVYIIAHRCNTPGDVSHAARQGANGVECDLLEHGGEIFVNHDIAAGPTLASWLASASASATEAGDKFALIIFDLKLAAGKRGAAARTVQRVRDAARYHFGRAAPVNTVFSVASFDDREALDAILPDLEPTEGVAIDQCDDPQAVNDYFVGRGVRNFWYGDGIFVLGTKDVSPYLVRATTIRDRMQGIKKTYVWTLAEYASIRDYFTSCGVDAVFVNVNLPHAPPTIHGIQEANRVLAEFNLRLALRSDDPFAVFRSFHQAEPGHG